MELLERDSYLHNLANCYQQVSNGNGHTVFLAGEAGVGKTSLVNHFIKSKEKEATIYSGACDSLFTPRPLGPLFDIAGQIGSDFASLVRNEKDRSQIFAVLIQELTKSNKPFILVFEDIHWADEATVDLIKFLARRIQRCHCLFLITYRDDEIHLRHPLKTLFADLPSNNFSKLTLERLSREAVNRLALAKGYASGDEVYFLTSGNSFYVTEILANYSPGIPERVKDSVLAVFHSKEERMQALWELLSILPSRIEFGLVKQIEKEYPNGIDECIRSGVIVNRQEYLSFKHELYRIAIEESLSIYRRKALHQKVLKLLLDNPVLSANRSQLLHHARFDDDKELVAGLAPQAAREAADLGAHIEASKLYAVAIEHTDKASPLLVELYERHAYECYLTNQIAAAMHSQQEALSIWRERKDPLRIGDTLRFLSRILWFQGQCDEVEVLALESVQVLENGFPTRERALAYSNLSQLNMLADDPDKTLEWGNKAIDLSIRLNDQEVLCHALNNAGAILMKFPPTEKEGEEKLTQSLSIALENKLHEHAARAYTNLSTMCVLSKQYKQADHFFSEGIKYCEKRDLNSWTYYMLSEKIGMLLEKGFWKEAEDIATSLYNNPFHPSIVRIGAIVTLARLKIRRGEFEAATRLIKEGKPYAKLTGEAHRIIPLLTAHLELCWINNEPLPLMEMQEAEARYFPKKTFSWHYTEFAYWKYKCGFPIPPKEIELNGAYCEEMNGHCEIAASQWKELGCNYQQALALTEGNEEDQKQALYLLDELGATATHSFLKSKMKLRGVKSIPRGLRESTRGNPSQLTNRQIDVLHLLKEGLQNAEIADKLFISAKTVDHHISAILSKLGTNTRTKAVSEARRLGILG